MIRARIALPLLLLAASAPARAGVLPDDRADVLYHRYDGGGVTIDGPSLLVRKKFAEKYGVTANYYVDMVSSASIDVVTTASPYKEERNQGSLAFDMLNGKSQYSLSFTNSEENDYTANSLSFDVSHEVRRRGDDEFAESVDRRTYRVGVSQILTPSLMMGLSYELVTDEGFLNNPYRSVRYLDPTSPAGYAYQPEVYPHTRTSNAASVRARYYLPYRAALAGEYRYFTDTWGIAAHTAEVTYTHPWTERWIFEVGLRFYTQDAADFYSDLFPYADAQNFLARDKELSTFSNQMLSVGATYELSLEWKFLQRSTLSFFYDRMRFQYDDFRDITSGGAPGTESLYEFDANVFRFFFSGWF